MFDQSGDWVGLKLNSFNTNKGWGILLRRRDAWLGDDQWASDPSPAMLQFKHSTHVYSTPPCHICGKKVQAQEKGLAMIKYSSVLRVAACVQARRRATPLCSLSHQACRCACMPVHQSSELWRASVTRRARADVLVAETCVLRWLRVLQKYFLVGPEEDEGPSFSSSTLPLKSTSHGQTGAA